MKKLKKIPKVLIRETKRKIGVFCPVENVMKTNYNKNCLLSYIIEPFLVEDIKLTHQNVWQVKEIARLISEYGYNVDVSQYDSPRLFLNKNYDLVIDIVPGKHREISKHLNPDCKKIAYFTTSNPSFQNKAEKARLEDLKKRRRVELQLRRQDQQYNNEIKNYDAYFVIGNRYNWQTFTEEFKLKDPFFIKNTGHRTTYFFDENQKEQKNFLYFGSSGQVHKGLDLLLEVFSEPGFPCDLYVCGAFKNEIDFAQEYHHELYECPNIHPIGFLDMEGAQFKEIVDKCVYSIMPSCSEGVAGSVLTTMSEGLINICSRECGLEDDEVIHLKDCSIETIRATVLEYAQKDDEWVKSKSKKSYDIIQERYSKENFIESLTFALDEVLRERD